MHSIQGIIVNLRRFCQHTLKYYHWLHDHTFACWHYHCNWHASGVQPCTVRVFAAGCTHRWALCG